MEKKHPLAVMSVLAIILVGASLYALAIMYPHSFQASFTNYTPVPTGTIIPTKAASLRQMTGMIQSLGHQSLVITLVPDNTTLTVNVNDKTQYMSSTSITTFSALKVGQQVQIRGYVVNVLSPLIVLAVSVVVIQT
ncbi:MAG TPA: hypothetical protein VEU97_00705 [Ktedonobacteraceae bacterium]|nr:hypothetical protein [Ktedonobacteraceae bacterium]